MGFLNNHVLPRLITADTSHGATAPCTPCTHAINHRRAGGAIPDGDEARLAGVDDALGPDKRNGGRGAVGRGLVHVAGGAC